MRRAVFAAWIAALVLGGGLLIGAARAGNYPSRPITVIVPFTAGGPSDAMMRILGERMKTTLGEAILIENVTGAGGSIGIGRAVRSPADGYTISFGHYAVTDDKRVAQAPDVPTTDEAGLPGFHMTLWSGLWVPKGTPKEIVDKLNAAAVEALGDPSAQAARKPWVADAAF
jgi:tripartite-type tricarboxylate transporter receptor subunit TctC